MPRRLVRGDRLRAARTSTRPSTPDVRGRVTDGQLRLSDRMPWPAARCDAAPFVVFGRSARARLVIAVTTCPPSDRPDGAPKLAHGPRGHQPAGSTARCLVAYGRCRRGRGVRRETSTAGVAAPVRQERPERRLTCPREGSRHRPRDGCMRVRDRPRKRRAPQGHVPRVVANVAARAPGGSAAHDLRGRPGADRRARAGCRRPGGVVRRRRRPHRALRRAGAGSRARRRGVRRRRVR